MEERSKDLIPMIDIHAPKQTNYKWEKSKSESYLKIELIKKHH